MPRTGDPSGSVAPAAVLVVALLGSGLYLRRRLAGI
ncbi:MAG: LPXTG cell wall anchor domain-containing protein [Chloroflexota bacterium]